MSIPPWVTDEPAWHRLCEKVRRACESLLARSTGLIEASRELSQLRHELRADGDPDFLTFVGIDSETDHLPIGRFREGWNADSLAQKDREAAAYETFYRAAALQAGRNLLEKYGADRSAPPER